MDLAENVDDLICTYEGTGDRTMDTLAMIIFGWILAAFLVLWLGKFVYARFVAVEKSPETKLKVETVSKTEDKVHGVDAVDVVGGVATAAKLGGVKSVGKVGGGKSVPATPPVRRRLTRQSPGPDLKKPKFIPAPQCTGPDNYSALWVGDLFQWLFNDHVVVGEVMQCWIRSLNEYCRKCDTEQGVGIEFVRILPETHPPSLTNLFCECDSKDDLTITCDCEATPAFQLKCTRQKSEKVETSHYRVNVNRLRARLNILCVTEKRQADLKCDGWPEIKIALAPVGNIKNNLDETQLQDVINEVVTGALRNTEFHIDFSQYSSCPVFLRHVETPGRTLPVHYDSMLNAYASSTPNHMTVNRIPGEKRLLVKVIRAIQLGGTQGCTEPYCVVEMDEPSQKNQTSVQKNTSSPYWDEHFLFDVSPNTAELLFEIYDHATKPNRFLGLAIVGVEELLINPSQRQTISLQSRPYESDQVSGTLTVEFLFIEGADIPTLGNQPYKIKETIRPVSPGKMKLTPSPTFRQENLTNGDHYTDDRGLDKNRMNYNPNKNTLIIHSAQRQPSQRLVKSGEPYLQGTVQPQLPNDGFEYRGRSRKRRDFFGTIKRRLGGRSKTRSKSAGPGDDDLGRDDSLNRSISADRGRTESYRLNVPGLRPEETSRRSSMSEASGLSSASTRTYVNEASTLVLETLENGIKKHYLVPLSLAQKSKWKKKGTKLHIFNDHTFIAKHLSGGITCQVCGKSVARRIGKQGYECRDCLLKCHKHCHVKVNDNCPTSTIHNIELSLLPILSE